MVGSGVLIHIAAKSWGLWQENATNCAFHLTFKLFSLHISLYMSCQCCIMSKLMRLERFGDVWRGLANRGYAVRLSFDTTTVCSTSSAALTWTKRPAMCLCVHEPGELVSYWPVGVDSCAYAAEEVLSHWSASPPRCIIRMCPWSASAWSTWDGEMTYIPCASLSHKNHDKSTCGRAVNEQSEPGLGNQLLWNRNSRLW